jgi:2,3,4,5-tetrahydropyridine-2-carboxylate N-succinyltransferase
MAAVDLPTFFDRPLDAIVADAAFACAHAELLDALEHGSVRAAELVGDVVRVNTWVKTGILAGFRASSVVAMRFGADFVDKSAYPPRTFTPDDGVRVVPGGTSVRRGAFLARGVIVMPPAYVNVGAYVDDGTLVDSHALVGSCAQVGKRVHLSAGAQIGGVLEPAGARPVVVEDEAFVGGLVGVFEGVHVRARAVLASGVVLTASTPIHDLVHERVWKGEVPAGAVVVPGVRAAPGRYAHDRGLGLSTPLIVKYRDAKTAAAVALEEALR